jgi:hypothetical protein
MENAHQSHPPRRHCAPLRRTAQRRQHNPNPPHFLFRLLRQEGLRVLARAPLAYGTPGEKSKLATSIFRRPPACRCASSPACDRSSPPRPSSRRRHRNANDVCMYVVCCVPGSVLALTRSSRGIAALLDMARTSCVSVLNACVPAQTGPWRARAHDVRRAVRGLPENVERVRTDSNVAPGKRLQNCMFL